MFNRPWANGKLAGQGAYRPRKHTASEAGWVVGPQEVTHAIPIALGGASAAAVFSTCRPDRATPARRAHLGVSLRTLQRYAATGNAPRGRRTWPCGSRAAGGSPPCTRRP